MNSDELELHYSGPSEMDAAALGQALEGVSRLVRQASHAGVFGQDCPFEVKVTAPSSGSLSIMVLLQSTVEVVGAADFLIRAVGFMARHLHKRVTNFEHIPERGTVKVQLSDGSCMEVTEAQWKLFNDPDAAKALKKVARPVSMASDALDMRGGSETLTITRSDLPQLEPPPEPGPEPQRFTQWVFLECINFTRDDRWRVTTADGDSWGVTIEDRGFLDSIDDGSLRIGRNDSFKVDMRVEVVRDGDGKEKVRRFIERVADRHVGAVPQQLPFEE
ncbi:hypothetical protein [Cutibacterium avidum]|uniref:hypothetical protein n=1 Tax=Cutibacterium avidum TaxID=33010 RepID=UPI0020949740|nr:hypothetical protein [Cutibacterium avidum]MDU2365929.1 hypothetical protein [Klebsiella michiganensis]MCO6633049.1 hypothetical protein [Cutibacterium avidum]MCO6658912.1 hypothetical protein [Cutibacterium avidum]MDQ9075857.1 hypothetical protein [Cutibacterium avidum]MDU2314302.1 hypothetical protein [Cutibacterium avidum]